MNFECFVGICSEKIMSNSGKNYFSAKFFLKETYWSKLQVQIKNLNFLHFVDMWVACCDVSNRHHDEKCVKLMPEFKNSDSMRKNDAKSIPTVFASLMLLVIGKNTKQFLSKIFCAQTVILLHYLQVKIMKLWDFGRFSSFSLRKWQDLNLRKTGGTSSTIIMEHL